MKVAFRVDASLQIGSGHVMRCLALADALQATDVQCTFVCRPYPGNMLKTIRAKYSCIELSAVLDPQNTASQGSIADYADWLGCSWQSDASETSEVLRDLQPDWLIVDHYALDSRWEERVQATCGRVMVIDDLANRNHQCQLLLDQNLGRKPADYLQLVPPGCITLVGPQFALLRPEFATARHASLLRRSRTAGLGHLLVSMGGADADNATGLILRSLGSAGLGDRCVVTVVLGQQNPWHENVAAVAATLPCETRVLVNSLSMASLMSEADLAIGAAGATAWERCCLGLPTILLTVAANQVPGARALHDAGAGLHIGGPECIAEGLPEAIGWMRRPGALQGMGANAAAICDGLGTSRIVDHIPRATA